MRRNNQQCSTPSSRNLFTRSDAKNAFSTAMEKHKESHDRKINLISTAIMKKPLISWKSYTTEIQSKHTLHGKHMKYQLHTNLNSSSLSSTPISQHPWKESRSSSSHQCARRRRLNKTTRETEHIPHKEATRCAYCAVPAASALPGTRDATPRNIAAKFSLIADDNQRIGFSYRILQSSTTSTIHKWHPPEEKPWWQWKRLYGQPITTGWMTAWAGALFGRYSSAPLDDCCGLPRVAA